MRHRSDKIGFILGLLSFFLGLHTQATTESIPPAALMKSGTPLTFKSSVMLTPTSHSGDYAPDIQAAINAVAKGTTATGIPGTGGVIFLAPGTYYLKTTLKIKGTGVMLVGVKDASGNYPTLKFGQDLIDVDYDNRLYLEGLDGSQRQVALDHTTDSNKNPYTVTGPLNHISVLDHPAAVRVLGNGLLGIGSAPNSSWIPADYSVSQSFAYEGLIGLNIVYDSTQGASTPHDGALATGIAFSDVHFSLCRDVTIDKACNGIDLGESNSSFFRNITITNLPNVAGNFGMNIGSWDASGSNSSNGIKVHGLTVSGVAGNTNTTLVTLPINGQLIGASLANGGVGIKIGGASTFTNLVDANNNTVLVQTSDAYLRSIQIDNVAHEGILLDYARQTYIHDLTINHAGADALKTTDQYYTGLLLTNVNTSFAGLNALHFVNGMCLNIANAILLDSNQTSSAQGSGVCIENTVTSCTITGARIGSNGTAHEQHGIYYLGIHSDAPRLAGPYVDKPTILASYVNFLALAGDQYNAPGASPISHSHDADYNSLVTAGYFNAPDGETWSKQRILSSDHLNDDPPIPSGPLSVIRGFNSYDLPGIRDYQWVDITALNTTNIPSGTHLPVVDPTTGVINSNNFTYWEGVAAGQPGIGKDATTNTPTPFVFYLPAGHYDSASKTYTPIPTASYNLTARLLINQKYFQLVGDGAGITNLNNFTGTDSAGAVDNTDNAIKIITDGNSNDATGSGVFGLGIRYAYSSLKPTTNPPVYQTTSPAILVSGNADHPVERIRLADLAVNYGMNGGISVLDTVNSDFYAIELNSMGVNSTTAGGSNPAFYVKASGTTGNSNYTGGSAQDLRLYQVYGNFAANMWNSTTHAYANGPDGDKMNASDMPDLTWVRIAGNVQRIRVDYCTFIEGVNGLLTVSDGTYAPQHVSTTLFATDHIYQYGIDLEGAAVKADFVESWTLGRLSNVHIGPGVPMPNTNMDTRFITGLFRGGAREGLDLQGGGNISIINCQSGNDYNLWTPYTAFRPKGSIYLGSYAGPATILGGVNGWLGNAKQNQATTNSNSSDFGLVLGLGRTATYSVTGTDQSGNLNSTGPIAQQTNTGYTVITP